MGVVSDVALRIFPREEGGSSAVFAYPTKPQCCQLASKAATALQEKSQPVLEPVVYRTPGNPCDLGSAVSVCAIRNADARTRVYCRFA